MSDVLIFAMIFGVALLAGSVVTLVMWVLFRLLSRVVARRALTRPPERVADPGRVAPALLAVVFVSPFVSLLGLLGDVASLIVAAIGGTLLVSAWVLHGMPGHSRNTKYVLYYLGGAAFGPAAIVASGGGILGVVMHVASAGLHVLAAVACLVAFRPDAPLVPGDPSSRRTLQWHRVITWIQGPDILSVIVLGALSCFGVGGIYGLLRWCIKGRAARHAVVYLRSFHYEDTGRAYSRLVTPAIHRTLPVTGLVHVKQSSTALEKDVPLLWRSSFASIADAHWQTWVDRHLERALAVVLDASVTTTSVEWEIERMRKVLPPERILVMHRAGTPAPAVAGLTTIAYELDDPAQLIAARKAVAAWTSRALASFDGAFARSTAPVSPPRFQIPVIVLLILFTGLPTSLIASVVGYVVTAQLRVAQGKGADMQIRTIEQAIQMYRLRESGCPSMADLEKKYLSGDPRDPWGTDYRIECGDPDVVRSAGPDRLWDTEDDLTSAER